MLVFGYRFIVLFIDIFVFRFENEQNKAIKEEIHNSTKVWTNPL